MMSEKTTAVKEKEEVEIVIADKTLPATITETENLVKMYVPTDKVESFFNANEITKEQMDKVNAVWSSITEPALEAICARIEKKPSLKTHTVVLGNTGRVIELIPHRLVGSGVAKEGEKKEMKPSWGKVKVIHYVNDNTCAKGTDLAKKVAERIEKACTNLV